ncbi:MAG: teicoplanin resistance protein VanZ, partial [Clostridiaceae bacterium]
MKRLIIVLCLFWFAFIFYMSGTPGTESHQESSKVVSIISENKNPRISLNNKKIYLDTIVR